MAQAIKTVTGVTKVALGGVWLVTAELELDTEYLAEGFVFTEAQLKEAGLTVGQVYAGWAHPVSDPNGFYSVTVSAQPPSAQTVKLRGFVLGTATAAKPFKESAGAAGELKNAKVVVTLLGK